MADRETLESWTWFRDAGGSCGARTNRFSRGWRSRNFGGGADGGDRVRRDQGRDRFAANGIAGLDDEARSGRPKTVDDARLSPRR